MVHRITSRFLVILTLFSTSFFVMAGSWTEVNLKGQAEFNNNCQYRIKSKAYGHGEAVLTSYAVSPEGIRFHVGGPNNSAYVESSEKQTLCTDALEGAKFIDISGNPCDGSSESCHQECIPLDSVLSIEELCQ